MTPSNHQATNPGTIAVSAKFKSIFTVLIFLGILAFVFLLIKDKSRAWHAYLIGYFYFATLGIGGLFFAAIQHVSRAGWSVNIRRFSESLTSYLPVAAVTGLIMLVGAPYLYEWFDKNVVAHDELLLHKASYLNVPFFVIRLVIIFGLWLFFQKKIVGMSLQQDKTADDNISNKLVSYSVAFLVVFALSYSIFSVDAIMALAPHWFSTIFGVYCFAGLFQSTVATLILMTIYFMKQGKLKGLVDENHLHDMGKYMFAFTVFWAYIAFSQFMLIWYANLPEETIFYQPRMAGSWAVVSSILVLFKFIVPFLALLPKWAKRTPSHLIVISCLIIFMQFVDLYWLIYPNLNSEEVVGGILDFLVWCGFLGLFLMCVTRFWSKHAIVPVHDPRQHESNHHHVVY